MKTVMKVVVASLLAGGMALASVASERAAPAQRSMSGSARNALYACRFEQTGRGDRLLNRSRNDRAVANCLVRRGIQP